MNKVLWAISCVDCPRRYFYIGLTQKGSGQFKRRGLVIVWTWRNVQYYRWIYTDMTINRHKVIERYSNERSYYLDPIVNNQDEDESYGEGEPCYHE